MTALEDLARPAARLPVLLRRQQLVRLSPAGWSRVLESPWDAAARRCLERWSTRGLPLVVTRQPPAQDELLALGLPAPARFGRRRLAVAAAPGDILFLDEFPAAEAVTPLLPGPAAADWRALVAALAAAGCHARVYGGYGWQAITRLVYVHPASDLDLLLPVQGRAHADVIAQRLSAAPWDGPRLDGELLWPDGAAVAWREWLAFRQGRTAEVLVKRLRGVALERLA